MSEQNVLTTWCFQCGAEFQTETETALDTGPDVEAETETALDTGPDVEAETLSESSKSEPIDCKECGVATTTVKPLEAHEVGNEDQDQIAYDFHEWFGKGRSVLDTQLSQEDIAHAWQGATLIVLEDDETRVDELIAEIEVEHLPTLDRSETLLVYEVDELESDQHSRLISRLDNAGLSYAFNADGAMYVYERDEEHVDTLISTLDQELVSERTFGPGVDVDQGAAMADLYLHLDKLSKKPSDAKAVIGFVETFAIIEQMKLPYGVTVEMWSEIIDGSVALREDLTSDKSVSDAEIETLAGQIAAILRKLV